MELTGNPKERRDQLKKEIDELGKNLPFKFEKNSQLRIMKALCTYIKKNKHLGKINQAKCVDSLNFVSNDVNVDQLGSGFMVCFTNKGELVYISENISDYFGINSLDVLFAYDTILEIPCKHDSAFFSQILRDYQAYIFPNKISFYSSWFVSRIQKKNIFLNEYKQIKMSGHYDPAIELFVFNCEPILSTNNRDVLSMTNPKCFKTIHKLNLQILDYNSTFHEFLGYNGTDFQDMFNLYRLLSPDSLDIVIKRHKDLLLVKNTRGYIDKIKLIHRNGGYIDCLLNMYYDPKGFIVCVYQMLTNEEIENLSKYMNVLNFDRNWENKTELNEDSSELKSDSFDECDLSHSSPITKHKFDDIREKEEDQEEKPSKKIKFEFNFNEALDIYNIGEALKKEIYYPECQSKRECSKRDNFQSGNAYGDAKNFYNQHYQIESPTQNNLESYDFENQFLQDCDLENFKCSYDFAIDCLADSNEKLKVKNQYLINNYENVYSTIYDRQIY